MVQVAIDAGPLHGPRTGIGNAVAWTIDALETSADVQLLPYVLSTRAKLTGTQRRLPLPAAFAHRWWSRSSTPRMDRWLGHPDIVHGTNYVVPPARAKRLVSVYDCWFLQHPDDANPDVRRAGDLLRRAVSEGASVVTSSQATTDLALELLDTDRVTTIHLGPPPTTEPPSRRPSGLGAELVDDPFVLALGTVERRKNLPMLIAAFQRLGDEHPTVRLVIAGRPGDDETALTAAIDRLPTSTRTRVSRLESVGEPQKSWLLHNADVLAYPSLDEGFGFPLLEAQLAGTAVVASSAGSIPEVAGSAALLSLPGDADALAVNLFGVVTSDQRRTKLVDAGRKNVQRFSWSSTAAALSDLYRNLASS